MDARGVVGVGSALALAVAALTASAEPTPAVEIRLFQFKPGAVEVKAGTAVTWTNGDDIEHTVTSGDRASDRSLRSAPLRPWQHDHHQAQ
jgi:plastocyanin